MVTTRHPWINHGRWITRCVCQQHIDTPTDTTICPVCGRTLHTPKPAATPHAVRYLNQRPVVNRNWTPTLEAAAMNNTHIIETVDDLIAENRENM